MARLFRPKQVKPKTKKTPYGIPSEPGGSSSSDELPRDDEEYVGEDNDNGSTASNKSSSGTVENEWVDPDDRVSGSDTVGFKSGDCNSDSFVANYGIYRIDGKNDRFDGNDESHLGNSRIDGIGQNDGNLSNDGNDESGDDRSVSVSKEKNSRLLIGSDDESSVGGSDGSCIGSVCSSKNGCDIDRGDGDVFDDDRSNVNDFGNVDPNVGGGISDNVVNHDDNVTGETINIGNDIATIVVNANEIVQVSSKPEIFLANRLISKVTNSNITRSTKGVVDSDDPNESDDSVVLVIAVKSAPVYHNRVEENENDGEDIVDYEADTTESESEENPHNVCLSCGSKNICANSCNCVLGDQKSSSKSNTVDLSTAVMNSIPPKSNNPVAELQSDMKEKVSQKMNFHRKAEKAAMLRASKRDSSSPINSDVSLNSTIVRDASVALKASGSSKGMEISSGLGCASKSSRKSIVSGQTVTNSSSKTKSKRIQRKVGNKPKNTIMKYIRKDNVKSSSSKSSNKKQSKPNLKEHGSHPSPDSKSKKSGSLFSNKVVEEAISKSMLNDDGEKKETKKLYVKTNLCSLFMAINAKISPISKNVDENGELMLKRYDSECTANCEGSKFNGLRDCCCPETFSFRISEKHHLLKYCSKGYIDKNRVSACDGGSTQKLISIVYVTQLVHYERSCIKFKQNLPSPPYVYSPVDIEDDQSKKTESVDVTLDGMNIDSNASDVGSFDCNDVDILTNALSNDATQSTMLGNSKRSSSASKSKNVDKKIPKKVFENVAGDTLKQYDGISKSSEEVSNTRSTIVSKGVSGNIAKKSTEQKTVVSNNNKQRQHNERQSFDHYHDHNQNNMRNDWRNRQCDNSPRNQNVGYHPNHNHNNNMYNQGGPMNDSYHHPPSPFNNQYPPYGNFQSPNFNPQWNNGYHSPQQRYTMGPNSPHFNNQGHNWNGQNDMHYHHHNYHGHNNRGRGNYHVRNNNNYYGRNNNSNKKNKRLVVSKNSSERQVHSGELREGNEKAIVANDGKDKGTDTIVPEHAVIVRNNMGETKKQSTSGSSSACSNGSTSNTSRTNTSIKTSITTKAGNLQKEKEIVDLTMDEIDDGGGKKGPDIIQSSDEIKNESRSSSNIDVPTGKSPKGKELISDYTSTVSCDRPDIVFSSCGSSQKDISIVSCSDSVSRPTIGAFANSMGCVKSPPRHRIIRFRRAQSIKSFEWVDNVVMYNGIKHASFGDLNVELTSSNSMTDNNGHSFLLMDDNDGKPREVKIEKKTTTKELTIEKKIKPNVTREEKKRKITNSLNDGSVCKKGRVKKVAIQTSTYEGNNSYPSSRRKSKALLASLQKRQLINDSWTDPIIIKDHKLPNIPLLFRYLRVNKKEGCHKDGNDLYSLNDVDWIFKHHFGHIIVSSQFVLDCQSNVHSMDILSNEQRTNILANQELQSLLKKQVGLKDNAQK